MGTIPVTGGGGFLGRHLVSELPKRGQSGCSCGRNRTGGPGDERTLEPLREGTIRWCEEVRWL